MRRTEEHKLGPKYPGLKELRPTNPLYKKLLSYRAYRLDDTSRGRSSRATGKVRDFPKRMEITLKEHRFSGEDLIRVLDFLAPFVREANIQGMVDGQAFLALPDLLTGFAKSQFEAGKQMVAPEGGGVSSWPEAVQYLLRNYAQSIHIAVEINELLALRQSHSETENSFAKQINDAVDRCGNVHSGEEVLTLFIDGLEPTKRTVVARIRESHRRSKYLEIVQYARAEGDAVRARSHPSKTSGQHPSRVIPVHLIQ